MKKLLKSVIKSVPTLITLFKKETPQEGKDIAKSGLTSLGISGMITTGRINAGELDETVLIILAIVEAIGYVYGIVALIAGSSQNTKVEENQL
ncbi:MAG: hypothetical protein CL670_04395 [Balneola sp.]|jgi:hypothetical protein|nr:hypothetical protein [Balneola sp.]MBE78371.1 hypothetical protein [Balneola sp.]|tara:strand:- start:601 stop:879 length:279 start_codon:yes stop_codon:yes gene_type:complete